MVRFRTLNLAAVIVVAILLLISCQTARPTRGEVIVYVAAPLSGWQANGGQTVVGGTRLAAEEINRRGGLLGYRVQIMPVDDEADSEVAVEVAREIADAVVREDKLVLGVIGHYNSGQTAAALEIYRDLPVVVVTPTASDPALTRAGYRRFFRVNATDAAQGPYDADFLINKLGAQRIVVVYAENDYGRGLKEEMIKALERLGHPAVDVIGIQEAANTYAEAVARIARANPDAVFLAGYETEGYVLLPELREAGIEATFMASDGCFLYDFVDGSGQWAEGVYVSGITPDPKAVADEDWWRAYQQLENRNPGTYSVAGYAAMTVLAEGVRAANSFDAEAISAALRRIKLSTLVGSFTYDDKGDMSAQNIYIFQVRNGEFVQVQP
ncbi:MAG: branched-chain amino acid ABC transporter substrate-binding protein [Chloroflexi bacterium]|nr:branched-chain amino acid ABC transporter substrate-binding protein [Chloroflexota bacterium]